MELPRFDTPPQGIRPRSPEKQAAVAFTVVELLLVLVVISVVLVVLIGSVHSLSAKGRQITCLNNLRNLGAMVLRWSAEHNGQLLPVWKRTTPWGTKQAGNHWAEFLNSEGYFELNWQSKETSIMRCPSRTGPLPRLSINFNAQMGLHYGMNPFPGFDARVLLNDAPFHRLSDIRRPGKTFLLGEVKYAYQLPNDPNSRVRILPHPREPQGQNLVFADGHAIYWKGELPVPTENDSYPWY